MCDVFGSDSRHMCLVEGKIKTIIFGHILASTRERGPLVAFFDWDDLVRDETVGMAMHGGCRLWVRSFH